MTNKILVVVRGGLVEDIFCTDENIEVTLIDWDNIKDGGELNLIEQNNFGMVLMDDARLNWKIDQANEFIQKNIDLDVEQRR